MADVNIVDLLTSETRCLISEGRYDDFMERWDKRPLAVNYGKRIGDRSPFLRGFKHNGLLYEINTARKMLIPQKPNTQLFYDQDKIMHEVVFEGDTREIVDAFVKKNYHVIEQ